MTEAVTYESRNRVAIITINRPKQMNAIDNQVELELAQAWLRFNASEDRVAILTGAGDKAFSAGRDRDPRTRLICSSLSFRSLISRYTRTMSATMARTRGSA